MALSKVTYSVKKSLLNTVAAFMRFERKQSEYVPTYSGTHMKRDQKRRVCVKEYSLERTRLMAIRRCNLLPPEIHEVAKIDVEALPRDSNYIRLRNRCYVTSRPRGIIKEFRVSRIIFRHLADYNKLCGIQKAMW